MHLSEESSFCRVRKAENGIPHLMIENNDECSKLLQKDQWIPVIIQIKANKISFFLIQNNIPQKIFSILEEADNENNRLGLLSYGSMAGFTDFEMMPNEDHESQFQNKRVENENETLEIKVKNNSKPIDYQKCLTHTKEEREKYCRIKFIDPLKTSICEVK